MQKIFKLKPNKKYFQSKRKSNLLSVCCEIKIDVSDLSKAEWRLLVQQTVITEELFILYPDKILQRAFYDYQELSEDFIRKHQSILNFFEISYTKNLSEEFMEEFEDRLTWSAISHQKLSESFIRKHKDQVYWLQISLCQKLSKDFIVEFIDKIDLKKLASNKNVSKEIKEFCRMFV